MWRWSYAELYVYTQWVVFSTYVEVILTLLKLEMLVFRILHVCGGDPNNIRQFRIAKQYSPRMWRWS